MSNESWRRGRMHADLEFHPDIGPRHRDRDHDDYRSGYESKQEEILEERRAEQRHRERAYEEEQYAAQAAQEQEQFHLEEWCEAEGHPIAHRAVPAEVLGGAPGDWPADVCPCWSKRYDPTIAEPGDAGLESVEVDRG